MKIGECHPKDSDACLQASANWDTSYTCADSNKYCESWGKDMKRCCPESCNIRDLVTIEEFLSGTILEFTEEDCNKFPGFGCCTYPNEAQCPRGKLLNVLLILNGT